MIKVRLQYVLVLWLMSSVSSHAEDKTNKPKAPEKVTIKAVKPQDQYNYFNGNVISASMADPSKGTKTEVIASNKKISRSAFLVKETTTLYDNSWKPITLDKLTPGSKIKIKFLTTKEGVSEAVSIRITE